jgi:6-phosphogluconolactonase (cycloisomerase 2 family)
MTPHVALGVRKVQVCLHFVVPLFLYTVISLPSLAQTPQQFVYASVPVSTTTSVVSAFAKDATNGNLTPTIPPAAADHLEGGLLAVDAKGRFVFVLNSTTSRISMYAIDPESGNLDEVQGSPFAASVVGNYSQAPTSPSCLAVEPSGQFLYVGYNFGNISGMGAINAFQIDAADLTLLPLPVFSTWDIPSSPLALLASPDGRFLYAALGMNRATGAAGSETLVYQIDPASGQLDLNGLAGNAQDLGRSAALDPKGRFFYEGWGQIVGHIDSALISPADGTATIGVSTLTLDSGQRPTALLAESSGKFLYVQETTGVATYSIDSGTGALTLVQPPSQLFSFHTGQAVADPLGPYLYVVANGGVRAFQVDSQAGALAELLNSPFSTGENGVGGVAISGSTSTVQAASGPVASFYPPARPFPPTTVGQSSSSQVFSITNTGIAPLSISNVSVRGANAGDFSLVSGCAVVPVQPQKFCTISVVFTPVSAGARLATLVITDNASSGSQSIGLTGTALAAQPEVTLNPTSFAFATASQGSTSTPVSVTITNTGTAALHVTSVGMDPTSVNPSDFLLQSNNCIGILAVQGTCVIWATFSPEGSGARTANLIVKDDAPDSPQLIAMTGTGSGTPIPRAAVSFSPTSMVFPTIAQGSSSAAQTLTITSTGSAALHITSITMNGANPGDFTLTNNCAAVAYAPNTGCSVSVTFTPSLNASGQPKTLGPRGANLVFTDDAPNSPQNISISGTSTDETQPISTSASVTVNSGNSDQTIKAGATATWNVSLTTNFTGSLNVSCVTPANAPIACSVPPTSVPVTATVPVSVKIGASTNASAAASLEVSPIIEPKNLQLIAGLTSLVVFRSGVRWSARFVRDSDRRD